jgi:hypothetical protein
VYLSSFSKMNPQDSQAVGTASNDAFAMIQVVRTKVDEVEWRHSYGACRQAHRSNVLNDSRAPSALLAPE